VSGGGGLYYRSGTHPVDASERPGEQRENHMSDRDIPVHYVCTIQEARQLVDGHDRFWVSNCGCREKKGECKRSRLDVCLAFNPEFGGTGSNFHEIDRAGVEAIFREADFGRLVARPFRNRENPDQTDGVCFCCDDCCSYFLDPAEKCDRGKLVEQTDRSRCIDCEVCAELCRFGARLMANKTLVVIHESCYGCGLCADICPQECIRMVPR
jgi:NAD-dependent dihydropyrimidine dehydrogenase PreA subunit